MTFGQNLRRAREQLNLSQEAAAKSIEKSYQVRLSAAYLSMIENGVKTNLTVKLINALLSRFRLPLSAASSLFAVTPDEYGRQGPAGAVKEAGPLYPEDEVLPEEAKQALLEFREFLRYKYKQKKSVL
ncbi:MAG: XRE family transcriptional regulator [Sporomusaceae bacterium]|nr:XRE family transcriptional regulator [Sporomusaceae bacterium]